MKFLLILLFSVIGAILSTMVITYNFDNLNVFLEATIVGIVTLLFGIIGYTLKKE